MDLSTLKQDIYAHKYKINFVEYKCEHMNTPQQNATINYNITSGKHLIATIQVIFSEKPFDTIVRTENLFVINAVQYSDVAFLKFLEYEAAYNNYYLNLYALKSFGVIQDICPVSSMFTTEKKRIYALITLHKQYPEYLYIPFLTGNYSAMIIQKWYDEEIKKELGLKYKKSIIELQEKNFADRHLEIQYRPMYK